MEENKILGLACPLCRVDLVMSARQGVEIDYCPKCRGIWLDRGEIDKIVEGAFAERQQLIPADRFDARQGRAETSGGSGHSGSGHRGYGHGGQRRSFLERLFD